MSNFANSIVIFIILFIIIFITKPSIFFIGDNIKPLIINPNNFNSFLTLHTFIIFLAFISYILANNIK